MGWWWNQIGPTQSSTTAGDSASLKPTETSSISEFRNAETIPSTITTTAPSLQASPPLDRNQQAFEELKSLFGEIDSERAAQAATRAKACVEKPKEDYSNSIYASTMSCSQCFDQAYYCSSMGGQLNNVYRYGALRSCTEQWAQWRFCMRTKMMSEDNKKISIREFNQRRAAKYKTGPSSEDVWEIRKEPVENPFSRSWGTAVE